MKQFSGVLTGYLGRLFFIRFIGLLIFFVIVMQMLDLLNQSSDIMAQDGASIYSMLQYISWRAPQIASQFTPFAALLGVVVTLSLLNYSSEITVMRAAGMSVHRVLFPVGFVCLLIAATHFIFHETVVVGATEKLAYWEANDYAVDLPPDLGTRTKVRLSFDNEHISAGSAARVGDAIVLNNVTIYDLDDDRLTGRVTEARNAVFEDGQWRLVNATTLNADTLAVTKTAESPWATQLDPELLFALSLDPERTGLAELTRKIGQLRADGADTRADTTSLLGRFSKPLATLVMPLLGAIAGFGMRRQGNQLARAVAGTTLGFSYFVAENLLLAFGKLGVVPAMLGAFFPFALFMVIGFSILLALEN